MTGNADLGDDWGDGPDDDADVGGVGDGLFDDPRVQAGVDHLRKAAHELIDASRSLLDVAEELVDDPKAGPALADLLGEVSRMVGRVTPGRPPGAGRRSGSDGDDDDDGPAVQRIPVS